MISETPLRWARRLRLLLRRGAAEKAMDDELRHHIECEVAEHVRAGMTPAQARQAALAAFGGIEQVKEEGRDARGTRAGEDLIADIGYGARILRRSPGFAATAVLTFALGSGAVTAIFSVVYGVLLRPLPYADPSRLVVLWERDLARDRDRNVVSVANFEAWRNRGRAFEGLAALVPRPVTLTMGRRSERLPGAEVSPGYFRLLGVRPALGRGFEAGDVEPAESHVVILSDGLWRRLFGADPGVIGRTLSIGGGPHSIVGVMPAGFDPPQFGWLGSQDIWLPFKATPENRSWGRSLLVVARLRAGVSLDQARAEMGVLGDLLAHEVKEDEGWTISVVPLAGQITGDVRTALLVVQLAVCLLLGIAVANVGMLSLSQARRRAAELDTRRALGATERRLFRQLFAESALIGSIGAVVGCAVAWPTVRLLTWLAPAATPRLDSVRLDAPVLLATVCMAILSTVGFGTLAARGSSGGEAARLIRHASDQVPGRTRGMTLIVTEVAIAVVLGVMASLMARSFVGLRAVDVGFTAKGTLAALVAVGEDGGTPARDRLFFEALLERVRALPAVQSAGLVSTRPFGGPGPATTVSDPRPRNRPEGSPVVADVRYTDAGFFRTLRIAASRGEAFEAHEPRGGTPRVVVSQTLHDAMWPGEDPVGRQLKLELFGGITADVIGVVPDLHLFDLRTPRPAAYLSDSRFPDAVRDIVVRFSGRPEPIVSTLRAVLPSLAPTATLYRVTTLPNLVATSLAADRFAALLLSAFGGLALLLVAVGVFGVVSTEITRRRKEIGIRLAVGARPSSLAAMLLRQSLAPALGGVVAGALLALFFGRLMRALLFRVAPDDPASLLTVTTIVIAVVASATLVPSLHAIRSSLLSTLREG